MSRKEEAPIVEQDNEGGRKMDSHAGDNPSPEFLLCPSRSCVNIARRDIRLQANGWGTALVEVGRKRGFLNEVDVSFVEVQIDSLSGVARRQLEEMRACTFYKAGTVRRDTRYPFIEDLPAELQNEVVMQWAESLLLAYPGVWNGKREFEWVRRHVIKKVGGIRQSSVVAKVMEVLRHGA